MNKQTYEDFFMNFSNKTKFEIIMSLKEKPLNVSQIIEKTNAEQSAVSHNLKHLADCHIVDVKSKGKQRIYSLNKSTVVPLLKIVEKHVRYFCPKNCEKNCPRCK